MFQPCSKIRFPGSGSAVSVILLEARGIHVTSTMLLIRKLRGTLIKYECLDQFNEEVANIVLPGMRRDIPDET